MQQVQIKPRLTSNTRAYARLTREEAVNRIGVIEGMGHEMPAEVVKLFDAGREWEALRMWNEDLRLPPPQAAKPCQYSKRKLYSRKNIALGTVWDIVYKASEIFGFDINTLRSRKRGEYGVYRMAITMVARRVYGISYPNIAQVIRGSSESHTSVFESVTRYESNKDQYFVLAFNSHLKVMERVGVDALIQRLTTVMLEIKARGDGKNESETKPVA